MALLSGSSFRDAADHATDRLPEPIRFAPAVTEAHASLRAHIAAGGRVSEWLQKRAEGWS